MNPQSKTQSSYLVTPFTIALWLVLCIWTTLAAYPLFAMFSGFIFALSLCSRIWGQFSLSGISYDLKIDRSGIFPGQEIMLTRTIYNGKMLPLLWLELQEPCSSDSYMFSLLKWHQTLTFTDPWMAKRRGIYRISEVVIRSGDGFSLCVADSCIKLETMRQIAVYPMLTNVSVDALLNDMWDSRSRILGHLEDTTLMKSVRDYTARDPARYINQRLLARGQGLKVNQYEVVKPSDVLFVLDAASFKDHKSEYFERVLSILASLLTILSRRGINVGLIAPRSEYFAETTIAPSNSAADLILMLQLLAAAGQDDPPLENFSYHSAPELGQIYYIAYCEKSATSSQIIAHFPPHKARILTFEALEVFAS